MKYLLIPVLVFIMMFTYFYISIGQITKQVNDSGGLKNIVISIGKEIKDIKEKIDEE